MIKGISSVAQPCPALCNAMDCSTPGFPVHHQLPDYTQTHDHRAGDAIQPSQPLSSPSPPVFNLSQHPGLSNESILCITLSSSLGLLVLSKRKFSNKHISIFNYQVEDFISVWEFS